MNFEKTTLQTMLGTYPNTAALKRKELKSV